MISPVVNRHDRQPPIAPGLEILDWADIPALVDLEEILFPGDSPWTWQMFAGELEAGHFYVVHRDPGSRCTT